MATSAQLPPGEIEVYGGRGPLVLGVTWSLFALSAILMAMRLYVSFGMKRTGGAALMWVIAAWVMNVATEIIATIGIRKYGIGNHIQIPVAAGVVRTTIILIWTSSSVALIAIGLGKVAAVFLVLQIQGNTRPKSKIFLLVIAAINMVGTTIVAIAIWFQCNPAHKLWDLQTPGNCNRTQAVEYLSMIICSISGASDFIIALYPSFIIWDLNISKRLKIGLSCLMGLATFTGVCAFIKVPTLRSISNTDDPTYAIAELLLWGYTESWVVLIVTLIPPTWPIRHAFMKQATSLRTRHSKSGHIYLSGDDLGPGMRGDHKSASKGRAFVDHTNISPSESSTADLPGNIIEMKRDIRIKREYNTVEVSRSPSKSHAASSESDEYMFRG